MSQYQSCKSKSNCRKIKGRKKIETRFGVTKFAVQPIGYADQQVFLLFVFCFCFVFCLFVWNRKSCTSEISCSDLLLCFDTFNMVPCGGGGAWCMTMVGLGNFGFSIDQ